MAQTKIYGLKLRLIPDTKVVRRKANDSIADGENDDGAERLKHSKDAPEVLRTYFFHL
jgi:hypothetical protein